MMSDAEYITWLYVMDIHAPSDMWVCLLEDLI